MSAKNKLKSNAGKPYLGMAIHNDILRFKSQLKRGDMSKISRKYNINIVGIYNFFDAPDVLSRIMLGRIYIAVEDFLGERDE